MLEFIHNQTCFHFLVDDFVEVERSDRRSLFTPLAGCEHVLNEFRHSCQRPKLKNVCHIHSKVK